MEIRFYDSDMNFIGVMENQVSLIWTRKYYEPGKARLFAPLTEENERLTRKGNLIWKRGSKEAAVIEDRVLDDTTTPATIEVTGRFLSSYMDRRLIRPKVTFSGYVEVAMRTLLSGVVEIPRVELGTLNNFTDTVSFQATYKNLLTYQEKLSKCSDIGFRFRPDFSAKKIYFETYKGKDRSRSQSTNSRVIFSERYDNLNGIIYRENDQLLKNVIYIGGEGEGSERTFVSYGDATGLDRRELFVDARDITRDEGMTQEQYEEKLLQRGHEKNTEYQESKSINCITEADANFKYGVDYDLGDIVTVEKKMWGISVDYRITEIEEVYEQGGVKISPTFGTMLPETIDWEDN